MFQISTNFQTPQIVCELMAKMAVNVASPLRTSKVYNALEPSPGTGQLVHWLENYGFIVYKPLGDFWDMQFESDKCFDIVVMNPPFNPVKEMERFVNRAMELSDNVIALLPVNYITSEKRFKAYSKKGFGQGG